MTEVRLNEIGNGIFKKYDLFSVICERDDFDRIYFEDIAFPVTTFNPYTKKYEIHITNLAREDEVEANFQIAHELVHLITPAAIKGDMRGGSKNVSVFEEGLATYFSLEHLDNINESRVSKGIKERLEKSEPHSIDNNYYNALKLVYQIPDLLSSVKLIRQKYPNIRISDFIDQQFFMITDDVGLIKSLSQWF